MTPKNLIQLIINLAIMLFCLYSYLYVFETVGFERAILILLFFGFMGIGGMINTVAQSIQIKNFKVIFTENDIEIAVLALRTAREKEEKKWQRNEFLEKELKFLKFLKDIYKYEPKQDEKSIIAEEQKYQLNNKFK
jgi:hypothetical protein